MLVVWAVKLVDCWTFKMLLPILFILLIILVVVLRRPRVRLVVEKNSELAGQTIRLCEDSLLVCYPFKDTSKTTIRLLLKNNLSTSFCMLNKMSAVVNDYTDMPELLRAGNTVKLSNVSLHYTPGFFSVFQSKSHYRLITIDDLKVWLLDEMVSYLKWQDAQPTFAERVK